MTTATGKLELKLSTTSIISLIAFLLSFSQGLWPHLPAPQGGRQVGAPAAAVCSVLVYKAQMGPRTDSCPLWGGLRMHPRPSLFPCCHDSFAGML